MQRPTLSGPAFSTHVSAVRLVLAEKGVEHRFEDYDPLADRLRPPLELARLVLDRVPMLRHDGITLYDGATIGRYVDEAFPGMPLQPREARERAGMNQVLALIDAQIRATLAGRIGLQRVLLPLFGGAPDEAAVAAALPLASRCVAALEALLVEGQYLVGRAPSLADLHLLPIMAYFAAAPEAAGLLAGAPRLKGWWDRMRERPSAARSLPRFVPNGAG